MDNHHLQLQHVITYIDFHNNIQIFIYSITKSDATMKIKSINQSTINKKTMMQQNPFDQKPYDTLNYNIHNRDQKFFRNVHLANTKKFISPDMRKLLIINLLF